MIRSLLGVVDVARDAVGAYVGILREHVKMEWATVLGGSFDERVEEAKARMEAQADMLAKAEEAEEVSEPSEPTCFNPQPGKHKFSHCDCDTAVDNEVRPAAQRVEVLGVCPTEWWPEDASGGHKCCLTGGHSGDHICGAGCGVRLSPPLSSPVAEAAVGEPRSGLSTPPVPAPGINVHDDEVVEAFIASQERRGEIAAHLQDALGDNYDWAPSSLPPCAILPFFHDMNADDGSVTPGIHHGFDWDGIVYDLLREFDIRKK